MRVVRVNGRDYPVPMRSDGSIAADDLRAAAAIPANRQLVIQRTDGSNQIVNAKEHLFIRAEDSFVDLAGRIRGR